MKKYSTEEAAKILNMTRQGVAYRCRVGLEKCEKVGRGWTVYISDRVVNSSEYRSGSDVESRQSMDCASKGGR